MDSMTESVADAAILQPHQRRSSSMDFYCLNILFILPFPYKLRAFTKGLSVRELRTPDESASTEGTRSGARRGFLILRHDLGTDFRNKRRGFCSGNWHGFGVALFSCPKKERHSKSPTPLHFQTLSSEWFLWALDP